MKKKITKKSKVLDKSFSSGEVMSLLENMNDGIKILAEGQTGLESRMINLEDRMGGLEGRMGGLEGKMDIMQADIEEIKYKLDKKVDREDFDRLERRVVKLEKGILLADKRR